MNYIGIDLHADFAQVARLHQAEFSDQRFAMTKEGRAELAAWVAQHNPCHVVIEACGGAYTLYDQLAPACTRISIVDGRVFRQRFPKRGRKTDQIDARNLALFASYEGDGIWIPDEKARQARVLSNDRVKLTELRTTTKNLIQSRLREYAVRPPRGVCVWSQVGLQWLFEQLPLLPQAVAVSIDVQLRLLQLYHGLIDDLDRQIAENAQQDGDIELIMSVPGVDYYAAFVVKAEMGDHRRFANAKKLVCYAGLNPAVSQSGKYCVTGSISRCGRSRLRWIVTECGLTAIHHVPTLKALHDRVKRRTRIAGKAKVDVGRKLLELFWHILRTRRPYDQSIADLHARKVKRMRARANSYRLTVWSISTHSPRVARSASLPCLAHASRSTRPPVATERKLAIGLDSQLRA